jgi:hypothetical protein
MDVLRAQPAIFRFVSKTCVALALFGGQQKWVGSHRLR